MSQNKTKEVWVVSVTKVEKWDEEDADYGTTVLAVYDNTEAAYAHYGDLCLSDDPTIIGAECTRKVISNTYSQ